MSAIAFLDDQNISLVLHRCRNTNLVTFVQNVKKYIIIFLRKIYMSFGVKRKNKKNKKNCFGLVWYGLVFLGLVS